MLPEGTKAPGGRVAVRPREWVDLTSFMGEKPLVLLFFPFAFSSTCTSEMCAVADDWSAWSELGGKVVGISVDSPYVNVRFAEVTRAPFPIVSDFNREATRNYDVLRPDLGGLKDVSERAVFVIDREGTIVYTWQGENPGVFPPLDEVRSVVARLVSGSA